MMSVTPRYLWRVLLLLLLPLPLIPVQPAFAELSLVPYVSGFVRPTGMVQSPIDPSTQYVLEKFGRILIVKNGVIQPDLFLDLSTVVWQDANGERGLLGLALAPDYAESGRAYVFFSSLQGVGDSVLARFTRSKTNPAVLDPASRFDLEWSPGERYIRAPAEMHKGGKLLFGPDGYLYVSVGDGGPFFDPDHRGQDMNTLLGKMLRIDVNVPEGDPVGYRVPADNPFVSGDPVPGRPEIWALGLRNPWRFSFDNPVHGGTGALVIADVGQDTWEEINYEPAGKGGRNYGWSLREGPAETGYPGAPAPVVTPLREPTFTYPHGALFGNSLTGGHVYRGVDLGPAYRGRYIFADFITRKVFSIPLTIDPVTGEAAAVAEDQVTHHTDELGGPAAIGRLSSIDTDANGELYFVDYSGGRILKLTADTDEDGLPDGWETQFGLAPESAAGANGATGDPDGDGRTNAQEFAAHTHPNNAASLTRYLAEGSSSSFFETTIDLVNLMNALVMVALQFLRTGADTIGHVLTIPPQRHATVRPADFAGLQAADFSTVIETNQEVVVERTMTWTRAAHYGSHAERAVTAPSTTWFLAEGATHGAFDLFYLLANPSDTPAQVEITYIRPEGKPPIVKPYTVGAHTRLTIPVDGESPDLAETDVSASIAVTNGIGIIVERAMYTTGHGLPFLSGHDSAGVTAASTHWFFAEGATGSYFDLYLLLANPGITPADVTVRYLLPDGVAPIVKTYPLAAQSRQTLTVEAQDEALQSASVGMVVESTTPIVAERSQYWCFDGVTWQESHNSPGATETGTLWAVAGGELGGVFGAQTYVLIANTSAFAGTARVTLLRENAPPLTKDIPLPADSRTNVQVGVEPEFAAAMNSRFGVVVESLGTTPAQLVIERATYSNDVVGTIWAAGGATLGTRLH